jgi:signal transduction histidine kinase
MGHARPASRDRRQGYRLWVWLGLWLLVPSAWAQPMSILIESAQVRLLTPDGEDTLRNETLPLHWDLASRGLSGVVELRLSFNRPSANTAEPWAAIIPRMGNAWRIELNGERLAEAGKIDTPNDSFAAKRPVWVTLPVVLLKPQNELRIVLRADAGRRAGLSRVMVGPTTVMRPLWAEQEWLRITTPQAAAVLSLLVGAFCALLWLQQRDRLYAAAAVGELAWGLRLADTWWEASPLPWPAWGMVVLCLFVIWSAALYLLIKTLWNDARPRMEQRSILLLLVTGPISLALSWWQLTPVWVTVWMLASLAGWMLLTLRLAWEVWQQPDGLRALLVLATAACVFALARDVYVGRAGALYFEESAYGKYAALSLALCILTIVSMRFKRARDDLVQANRSIQARIEARERELNVKHAQVTAMERDKATAEERARVLRDMHDGAGAHLITAIRQVERGDASRTELLQTLQESLDQLRLSVDAIHLPQGDINALLASLRFRLERRITAAGLGIKWRADELPVLANFQATQMRHLQFMLMEAISNVIQHAQASHIALTAVVEGQDIKIELQDDGVGMGMGAAQGNGRRIMQERAALIDACLSMESTSQGTCLRITLLGATTEHQA